MEMNGKDRVGSERRERDWTDVNEKRVCMWRNNVLMFETRGILPVPRIVIVWANVKENVD